MLLSTKDQGLGRRRRSYSHSHVYSMNTAARSSKLSLLSAITTHSTGSNGSSSTVTQESYNKSRTETARKRKSSKRRRERTRSKTPPMEALEEAISEGEDEQGDVDVFAFLVEEAATQPEDASDDTIKAKAEDAMNEKDVTSQSLHSDSGISMDDGSLVLGQTTLKPLLSTLPEQRSLQHGETSQVRFDWTWPDVPKPKHSSFSPPGPPHHWDGIEYPTKGVDNGTYSPQGFCFTPEIPESCQPSFSNLDRLEYVGAEASSHSFHPPFGAFTHSCQHLLLGLQQELSKLQSELKQLEAYLDTIKSEGENSGLRNNFGRVVLGVATLLAAFTLQLVSGLHLKLLMGVQLIGMIVALCLPLRN